MNGLWRAITTGAVRERYALRQALERAHIKRHTAPPDRPIAGRSSDELRGLAWSDKVGSGWRKLEVADVARELSPAYARLSEEAAKLRKGIDRAEWARGQRQIAVAVAERDLEHRWSTSSGR